jgi:hypothetical protein
VLDRRRIDVHWVIPNFVRATSGDINIFIFVEADSSDTIRQFGSKIPATTRIK